MGGYSPVSFFGADRTQQAVDRALLPVVEALRADGTPYCGCLYAGLMVGPSGLQVLEYNARFGDPETQVVMPRLQTDPIELLQAATHGELAGVNLRWSGQASVGVVMASRGYPGRYLTGFSISGLGTLEPGVVGFHAGTSADPSGYVTSGGRVLTVVALGDSISEARERAYRNVERIHFEGASYRHDLALRELEAAVPG
jgi:phosphoribosylamine--glycine ligase